MKTASLSGKAGVSDIEGEYCAALRQYVARGGESGLRRAYELGRRALEEGKGLIEVASYHQHALSTLLARSGEEDRRQHLLQASVEFLLESLSPYEMAYRGFHDAIRALRRLNETLEEETKRIAAAVHDEAGQSLVAVHIALAELSRDVPAAQSDRIRRIEGLLEQAEGQLRRLSHELRPSVLDDLGWIPAIRFLADGVSKRAGINVRIQAGFNGRLRSTVETALYRVVQEALTNATKHAKAVAVTIQIRQAGKKVSCSIQDDGVGFEFSAVRADPSRGLGLVAMQERINAVGGTFSVETAPGRGTRIVIQVPKD